MRLIISVVGKHFADDNLNGRASNATIYRVDETDPDLMELQKAIAVRPF